MILRFPIIKAQTNKIFSYENYLWLDTKMKNNGEENKELHNTTENGIQ